MPKVTISDSKGIFQEAGSGLVIKSATDFEGQVHFKGNQVHGHKKKVTTITREHYGDNSNQFHLSGSDSGRVFILGDVPGTRTILIPDVSAGWNATFVVTGAIGSAITISGSIDKDTDPWAGNIIERNDGTASEDWVITAGTGIVVGTGTEAGDGCTVEVMASGNDSWIVTGQTAQ